MTPLNPGIAEVFDGSPDQPVAGWADLTERSFTP
jgi:hypothetical protein